MKQLKSLALGISLSVGMISFGVNDGLAFNGSGNGSSSKSSKSSKSMSSMKSSKSSKESCITEISVQSAFTGEIITKTGSEISYNKTTFTDSLGNSVEIYTNCNKCILPGDVYGCFLVTSVEDPTGQIAAKCAKSSQQSRKIKGCSSKSVKSSSKSSKMSSIKTPKSPSSSKSSSKKSSDKTKSSSKSSSSSKSKSSSKSRKSSDPCLVTICYTDSLGTSTTMDISTCEWGDYWAQGATWGACDTTPLPPTCVNLSLTFDFDALPCDNAYILQDLTQGTILDQKNYFDLCGFENQVGVETYSSCVAPNNCYSLIVMDQFCDGICCFFGTGNYTLCLGDVNPVCVSSPSQGAFICDEAIQVGGCGDLNGNQGSAKELQLNAQQEMTLRAFPNPIENKATIEFTIPEAGDATVSVSDINGETVGVLFNGTVAAGDAKRVQFDSADLSSGIYFVKLVTATKAIQEKVVILK